MKNFHSNSLYINFSLLTFASNSLSDRRKKLLIENKRPPFRFIVEKYHAIKSAFASSSLLITVSYRYTSSLRFSNKAFTSLIHIYTAYSSIIFNYKTR